MVAHTRREPFDPEPHRDALTALLAEVAAAETLDARALDRLVKRHPKGGTSLFSKSEMLAGLRAFAPSDAHAELVERLRLRPVRTLSGVTPVAVLTRPHPCPGTCVFCPSDVRMPKSYLADEPGAQRAEQNAFDPYLQTWNRLDAYRQIGHPVDKVELIVLGGTFSAYPEPYQIWFLKRCLDALSDFGEGWDGRLAAAATPASYRRMRPIDGRRAGRDYNRAVGAHLRAQLGSERIHASEREGWGALRDAQGRNESARCRCVGLSVETRPDHVDAAEVLRLRRLGATKVQLGIQSADDALLARNRRGHGVAESRAALARLRGAGLKLHGHWMLNLLGATPESDAQGFDQLFGDPGLRPDELKLYPCLLVASAPLHRHYADGSWSPYPDDVLADLLAHCLVRVPRWCRVTRVVRDFSAGDVLAGTHVANLREVVERRLDASGRTPRDIRSREIRGRRVEPEALRLEVSAYASAIGEEQFLEWVTPEDRIAGFLRLTLPRGASELAELGESALVRELHVYGPSLALRSRTAGTPQHAGLGRRLLEHAAGVARARGYRNLAVVSAVGTRDYYRARGFSDGELYQHLALR